MDVWAAREPIISPNSFYASPKKKGLGWAGVIELKTEQGFHKHMPG